MAHPLHPVQRLPPELIRRISDQLVGIKEWVAIFKETDTPPPRTGYCNFALPTRKVDFIGLRTLPSLATASRFFLEPALDALWDTLPDYGILVYVLPKDAWVVDVIDDGGQPELPPEFRCPQFQHVSIVRPLSESEFKRVQYYAPRVKRIQELCPLFPSHLRGYVTYESSVLETLASHCSPDNPLFPNLRTLDVSPSAGQFKLYYRFFHVLFGPRLWIINNSLPANLLRTAKGVLLADYRQMLMRLQESAPHLRHLKLYIDLPSYSPAIISAMSSALRSFKHLNSPKAWPDMCILELGLANEQKDTQVTLAALVPFAQHCPKLQMLGFTLNADLSRLPVELRESRESLRSVEHAELGGLKVGRARIADPEGVAAFLVDLFPRLEYTQDDNLLPIALALAQADGVPLDEDLEVEVKCHQRWKAAYEKHIPALASERGIDREYSLDDTEAHVVKAWHT